MSESPWVKVVAGEIVELDLREGEALEVPSGADGAKSFGGVRGPKACLGTIAFDPIDRPLRVTFGVPVIRHEGAVAGVDIKRHDGQDLLPELRLRPLMPVGGAFQPVQQMLWGVW